MPLLERRNGFTAFEGALHLFSDRPDAGSALVSWNAAPLWRDAYGDLAGDAVFFAEDAFGNQFCLQGGGVELFDAETGAFERLADDLEGWAQLILAEYDLRTGWSLARDWQRLHGPIPEGTRLLPKKPFVLGGDYAVDNLYSLERVKGMRLRGEIALQIRDLPDGAAVALVLK
jgi:hypothetical protein